MEGDIVILLTFIILIGIYITFLFWSNNRKKNHLMTIESDWKNLKKAIENNHVDGIVKFGTAVIWNEHFTMVKLKEMKKLINVLEKQNPEIKKSKKLENLKLLIFNKSLDWNTKHLNIG
ncbi:hypothetical protein [Tenacibaculum halocynthiae]|uniref:hypothetical protein n=1 Tax=Tenacibaculum halocynthiae TaxID=1254437 RepID=UPI003894F4BE